VTNKSRKKAFKEKKRRLAGRGGKAKGGGARDKGRRRIRTKKNGSTTCQKEKQEAKEKRSRRSKGPQSVAGPARGTTRRVTWAKRGERPKKNLQLWKRFLSEMTQAARVLDAEALVSINYRAQEEKDRGGSNPDDSEQKKGEFVNRMGATSNRIRKLRG